MAVALLTLVIIVSISIIMRQKALNTDDNIETFYEESFNEYDATEQGHGTEQEPSSENFASVEIK